MVRMGKKLFSLFITFLCCYSFAQTGAQRPHSPKAKITWITPYQAVIDFEDGRQARLLAEQVPMFSGNIKLDLVESTCQGFLPAQRSCAFVIPVRLQLVSFLWTRYPTDPTKIGKQIKKRTLKYTNYNPNDPNPVFEFEEPEKLLNVVDFADESVTYRQAVVPDNEKWNLVCENKSLFSPIQRSAEKLEVMSLASEFNLPNPETQAAENRGFQSLQDVSFSANSLGYRLDSIATGTFDFSVIAGQAMHWVIATKQNKFCELSFSVDVSQLSSIVSGFQDRPPEYKKAVAPRWFGSTELRNLSKSLPETLNFDGILE